MNTDCKISIMVLGEIGVGKTSLLVQFLKGTFSVYQASTAITRHQKVINIMDKNIQLELWDTGGDSRFKNAIKGNYNKVDGVILVYDVTDVTSFYKLSNWLEEFRSTNDKAIVLIVGNKNDNPDVSTVSRTMVKNFAAKDDLKYFQTSAKSGENVKKVFEHLTLEILIARKIVPPVNATQPHISTLPNQSKNASSKNFVAQTTQQLTTVSAICHSTNSSQRSKPQMNSSKMHIRSGSNSKTPSQAKQSSNQYSETLLSNKMPVQTVISSKKFAQEIFSKTPGQEIASKEHAQAIPSKDHVETTASKDPVQAYSSKEHAQTIASRRPAQSIASQEPATTTTFSKSSKQSTISPKQTSRRKDSEEENSQSVVSVKHCVQPENPTLQESTFSNELENSDEKDFQNTLLELEEDTDWCFPDVEYLNSKEPIRLLKQEHLPPVIPLPDDTIQLHIEKLRQNRKLKNDTAACCGV